MKNKIVINFTNKLNTHLKNYPNYLTEDIIRFIFYKSLICNAMLKNNNIQIEKRYKDLLSRLIIYRKTNDPRVDMYVKSINYAIEFKFHNAKSETSQNTTEQLGELVNDMCRLATINEKNTEKYLIYVTDKVMDVYIRKLKGTATKFKNLYTNLNYSTTLSKCTKIKPKTTKTFYNSCYKSINIKEFDKISKEYIVELVHKQQIQNKYHLRIFKIYETASL